LRPSKKARELAKKLMQIGKVDEKQACKMADLLPKEREEVVAIFAKETYIPSEDEIEQILEVIREYI